MNVQNEFPQEHLVELIGLSPFLVGRIVIFEQASLFNVEIDLVQKETGKIYNHVKSMFNCDDPREALGLSVQHLKDFLDSKKN